MPARSDVDVRMRLQAYLKKDKKGIRKAVIKTFISGDSYTTEEIYKQLTKKYDVTYKGMASMVGLMNARMGILHVDINNGHNRYCMRDEHRELTKSVLDNY